MKKSLKIALALVAGLTLLAVAWFAGGPPPATPAPSGLPADVLAVVTPDVTATPDMAATPDVAATPSATATPGATSTPDATGTPGVTATPNAAATPGATPAPNATPAPDATSAASVAPTPGATPTAPPDTTPAPNTAVAPETGPVCTVFISCATVLDKLALLGPAKAALIPADGVLLATVTVEFSEGESAFDLLRRVTRDAALHFEFALTPALGTAYIEGIGNLYEFDCGELSGWMYSANGVFPSYGCSQYIVQPGDSLRFLYSCDLGEDVGGANF